MLNANFGNKGARARIGFSCGLEFEVLEFEVLGPACGKLLQELRRTSGDRA
jgi:hypothetical protein